VIDHVGDDIPLTRFEGTSHLVNRYDGEIPIVISMGFSGDGRIAGFLANDAGGKASTPDAHAEKRRIADFFANDAGDDCGSF